MTAGVVNRAPHPGPDGIPGPMTADALFALKGDGLRHELIAGRLTTMPPTGGSHGDTTYRVTGELYAFTRAHGDLGCGYGAETGFLVERDPDTVRAPDAAFVGATKLARIAAPGKFLPFAPDLAVEVVSPNDTHTEVLQKVAMWLRSGAELVWLLDPGTRTVEVHRRGVKAVLVLGDEDTLDGSGVLPGFAVSVRDLFGPPAD